MSQTITRRYRKPPVRRVTYTKADRALLAVAALAECQDVGEADRVRLNAACDAIRSLRDRTQR